MKLKISIASRVIISYALFFAVWGFGIYLGYQKMNAVEQKRKIVTDNYRPSSKLMVDLAINLSKSRRYLSELIYEQNVDKTNDILSAIHNTVDKKKSKLVSYSTVWSEQKSLELLSICSQIDSLFFEQSILIDEINETDFSFKKEDILQTNTRLEVKSEQIVTHLYQLELEINRKIEDFNTDLLKLVDNNLMVSAWVGTLLFFIVLLSIMITINGLLIPVSKLKKMLESMTAGAIPDRLLDVVPGEVGKMSAAVNKFILGIQKISQFSKEIAKGNYDVDYELLGSEDELGNSLLLMKNHLEETSKENMLRRKENTERNWATQGIAKFGEMLREIPDDAEKFANHILVEIIRYLDASIGGVFIIQDDDKEDVFLKMVAFFAYDRRKYIDKEIRIGESLVGQCVLENETIFMTDIPDDYVHITSGLGADKPRSLVLVPLKINDQTFGVLEIASFKVIEQYQVEFIEKVGESVASTISGVKVKRRTARLLKESNEKSQRLTMQEAESKKQIDDMEKALNKLKQQISNDRADHKKILAEYQADIQSLRKKNNDINSNKDHLIIEIKNMEQSINNSVGTYSISLNGEFLEANEKYLKLVKQNLQELRDKRISDLEVDAEYETMDIHKFSPILLSGQKYDKLTKYIIKDEPLWLYETFTPLYDENGKFAKILCIVRDETSYMKKTIELQGVIDTLKTEIRKLKQRV